MSASKRKGTAFETAVVDWLRTHGFPWAERRALAGSKDKGDVSGVIGVVLEIKNCNRQELAAWVDEARAEAANAGVATWAVVAKRRGKSDPGEAFVITNLATFAPLLADDDLVEHGSFRVGGGELDGQYAPLYARRSEVAAAQQRIREVAS